MSDHYLQKYNIPRELFTISQNKDTTGYLKELERAKFDQ